MRAVAACTREGQGIQGRAPVAFALRRDLQDEADRVEVIVPVIGATLVTSELEQCCNVVDHDSLKASNDTRMRIQMSKRAGDLAQPNEIASEMAAIRINVDSLHKLRPARLDSINNGADDDGSGSMAMRMVKMDAEQPGFLGVESVREDLGITVSYWRSLEDIANWKRVADHLEAQRNGREKWYATYKTRICKVERDYGFER